LSDWVLVGHTKAAVNGQILFFCFLLIAIGRSV